MRQAALTAESSAASPPKPWQCLHAHLPTPVYIPSCRRLTRGGPTSPTENRTMRLHTCQVQRGLTGCVHQRDLLQQPVVALRALKLGQEAGAKLQTWQKRENAINRNKWHELGWEARAALEGARSTRCEDTHGQLRSQVKLEAAANLKGPGAAVAVWPSSASLWFAAASFCRSHLRQACERLVRLHHQCVARRAPLVGAVHHDHKPAGA